MEKYLSQVAEYVDKYKLVLDEETTGVEIVNSSELMGEYAGAPAYETRYYAVTTVHFKNTAFAIVIDESENKLELRNEESLKDYVAPADGDAFGAAVVDRLKDLAKYIEDEFDLYNDGDYELNEEYSFKDLAELE